MSREENEWTAFLMRVRQLAEDPEHMWDPIYERTGLAIGNSQRLLLAALADYLGSTYKVVRGCGFHHYLHKHVADALAAFRAAPEYEKLRREYTLITGDEIPDFVEHHLGGLHRLLVVRDIAYHLAVASGRDLCKYVRADLDAYSDAQRYVVDQAWRAFCRVAYKDVFEASAASKHRTLRFEPVPGGLTLTTFSMAGRLSFDFTRDEESCSYVADEGDPSGQRSGPNTTATRYDVCVAMIEEVTRLWDPKKLTHPKDTW